MSASSPSWLKLEQLALEELDEAESARVRASLRTNEDAAARLAAIEADEVVLRSLGDALRGPREDSLRGPHEDALRGPHEDGLRGPHEDALRGPHEDALRGPHEDGLRGPHEDGLRGPHEDALRGPHEDALRGPHEDGLRGPHEDGLRGPHEDALRGPHEDALRGWRWFGVDGWFRGAWVAAGVAVAVVLWHQPGPWDGVKGEAMPVLRLAVQHSGQARFDPNRVRIGDAISAWLTCAPPRTVHYRVVVVDGAGESLALSSGAMACANQQRIPGAFSLDTPGPAQVCLEVEGQRACRTIEVVPLR